MKSLFAASLALLPAIAFAGAALTEMEVRWLKAASPVLAYAQQIKLPIDVIVQPVTRPNDVPLAMGFRDGRCKLVLSMRGNPEAEKIIDHVPADERAVLMEAMAAHEVAHCWRYAQGVWHALPAGFVETGEEFASDAALLAASKAMREHRREEGYADLVALAWTQRHHPDKYQQVYTWLAALRNHLPVARSGHDTRVWVRLARDSRVFHPAATPFDAASAPWRDGLLGD